MPHISPLDVAALVLFLVLWAGYARFADHAARTGKNLMTVMHAHRLRWMRRMLERENRMQDVQSLATQMRSVSLFASTTIFILGGLVALFGAVEQARQVIGEIPFAVPTPPGVWEMKLFVLLAIFVYAFFKFAWSLRQFNYGLSLIGAAPSPSEVRPTDRHVLVERMARVTSLAANNFNGGMRAYYFALAALPWFVHPVAFMAAALGVVAVVYRREFRSFTLATLSDPSLAMPPE